MKKTWNAPVMEELTIRATFHGFGNGFGGNGFNGGHGHGGHGGGNGGHFGGNGLGGGRDNVCRCQGGTSPCDKHDDCPSNGNGLS